MGSTCSTCAKADEVVDYSSVQPDEVDNRSVQPDKVDYSSVQSLWAALEDDAVRLLRGSWLCKQARQGAGSWLCKQARQGAVLPRRQDCPPEAFLSLSELKDIHENSKAKPEYSEHKRAPIVAVSHFWRSKEHPDPEGVTLKFLSRAFEDGMRKYEEYGFRDVGVFLDWCSLFQEPRASPQEQLLFKRSLKFINLWYAHALTTVYLVTDAPKGVIPYHQRGWTTFEYQLAWLIKLADKDNVWPQVVDLGRAPQPRPALAAPDAFEQGRPFGQKVFTNGADRELVALKFKETCVEVLGTAKDLDFDGLNWGDAEISALGVVFPLCSQLEALYLNNNRFTRVPETLGQLRALRVLNLGTCSALQGLPETLGELRALEKLDLRSCSALQGLPKTLGQLRALRVLYLPFCSALQGLPETLGQLRALEELHLHGCSALGGLPTLQPQVQVFW